MPSKVLAVIGLHHGRSIRWDVWEGDGCLVDGLRLIEWLAARGVEGPKREYDDEKRAKDEHRWRWGMPSSLHPIWDQMHASSVLDPGRMQRAFEEEFSDLGERALKLFAWFGRGAGPWTAAPSYESVAEDILLAMPTPALLAALREPALLMDCEREGAARYFAGSAFHRRRAEDVGLIPDELKNALLQHVLKSEDRDKRERATIAFG